MANKPLISGQVILEFALAFILIVVLLLAGFQIWLNLNSYFITDVRSHQTWRNATAAWGSIYNTTGGPTPVDPSGILDTGDSTWDNISKISTCTCVDYATRESAVRLYTDQARLTQQISAYNSVIEGLNSTIDSLENLYWIAPECILVRECESLCGGCDEEDWCYSFCEGMCWGMALIVFKPTCDYLIGDAIEQLEAYIADTEAQRNQCQSELDAINSQIAQIEPQISCCFD